MKNIKIFLASSNELIDDRQQFEKEIYRKSKLWSDGDIGFHLEIWEDLSSQISRTRLQDEYNKKIKEITMSSEIKLDSNTMIVSETDSKGNILYANNDFCAISGFTKEELIGRPHSMVRHNDMPKAAFKDLWNTVQNNKTWNGIVKNLTKNGNFYWVNATAYPVTKKNGEKRFISVRIKPTQEEIINAENLYKKMIKEEY